VYTVIGSEHFFNGSPLGRIEEFAGVGMGCSLLFWEYRLDRILAALHVRDGRQLRGDSLAGSELPPGFMFLAVNGLEFTAAVSLVEARPNLVIGEVAHTAPQGVAQDIPFVGNSLALEATILGKGDCFVRPLRRIRHPVLCQSLGSFSGCRDDIIGLVAELGRNLAVGS
jgi:hypothetical protein